MPGNKKKTNSLTEAISLPLMPERTRVNFVPDESLGLKSVRTTPPGMSMPRSCDGGGCARFMVSVASTVVRYDSGRRGDFGLR